jgi:hypothetical protein
VDLSGYAFDPTKLYRVWQDACGDESYSNLFVGACSEPPALAGFPFDDADLVAYWPAVCPPRRIVESVTESPAILGPCFDTFVLDGALNVVLVADGEGAVAYGATPGTPVDGGSDITLAARVLVSSQPAAPVTLFGYEDIAIQAYAHGAKWALRVVVIEDGAGVTTLSSGTELDFGAWYDLVAVHDVGAGDLIAYAAGAQVAASLGSVGARTNGGTFSIGQSDNGLITNCAVWDRVLAPTEIPGYRPTVTIEQAAGQADPTTSSPVLFDVVFAVPVTGFATGDVTLSGTAGATTAVVTGSGTTYSVSVSGMTSAGTVIASIAAGVCTSVATGTLNVASTSSDHTVTVSALTVTVEQAAGQADPATSGPILFTATFSQAVTGFATGDVTLSGTAGATTAVVSGSGPYTITVSGMTGSGTVIASIGAGVCTATGSGIPNSASTSSDHTVTYNALGALYTQIVALSPLSYWTLRDNNANTLHDYGSLALDLTNSGGLTMNTIAGGDGHNYPDSSGGGSAHLVGSDSISYEPLNASGLTVFFFIKNIGGNSNSQPVNKSDSTGNGTWRMNYNTTSGSFVRTVTSAGANARRRTGATELANSNWNSVVFRFGGAASDYPDYRVNGSNITGTTADFGSTNSNSTQPIRLFGHGGATSHASCSLAHVAIFAGKLSDANCALIEAAAATDGW